MIKDKAKHFSIIFTLLLSGFGGDQGISSPIPARFILPSLINDKQFHKAWSESAPANVFRRLVLLAQCAHPSLHKLIQQIRDLKSGISNAFKPSGQQRVASTPPYHRHYFKTLREVSLAKAHTQDQSPHKAMIKCIQAFMLNEYINAFTRG